MRKHPKPEKGIAVRYAVDGTPSYRGHVWSARDLGMLKDPALRASMLRGGTDPTYPPTRAWIEVAAEAPLLFQPGSAWHYSNIGYRSSG